MYHTTLVLKCTKDLINFQLTHRGDLFAHNLSGCIINFPLNKAIAGKYSSFWEWQLWFTTCTGLRQYLSLCILLYVCPMLLWMIIPSLMNNSDVIRNSTKTVSAGLVVTQPIDVKTATYKKKEASSGISRHHQPNRRIKSKTEDFICDIISQRKQKKETESLKCLEEILYCVFRLFWKMKWDSFNKKYYRRSIRTKSDVPLKAASMSQRVN